MFYENQPIQRGPCLSYFLRSSRLRLDALVDIYDFRSKFVLVGVGAAHE